jgi:hypothetical protein
MCSYPQSMLHCLSVDSFFSSNAKPKGMSAVSLNPTIIVVLFHSGSNWLYTSYRGRVLVLYYQ